MPGEDNVRLLVRFPQTRETIAVSITPELIAMRFHIVGPDALGSGLEARGRRGVDQSLEKFERGFVHVRIMQTAGRGGKTSTAEKRSGTMRLPR